jgi:hypothetical protein
MPDAARPRLGLQAIAGSDAANTIDTTSDAQMDIIDAQTVMFSQGVVGSRPTSTPGTPGKEGRVYYATDTSELYYDFGTGWKRIWPPDAESLTTDMFVDSIVSALGLNDSEGVRRGKSIIPAEEITSSAAYIKLATNDQVQVVLPTDGLIVVGFHAAWKVSSGAGARAAIFIGGDQLKTVRAGNAAPLTQAAAVDPSSPQNYAALVASPPGLVSIDSGGADYSGPVTTGQTLAGVGAQGLTQAAMELGGNVIQVEPNMGGLCPIFAAAGTHTVSVQFKTSAGTISVKDRKLWVWTVGF